MLRARSVRGERAPIGFVRSLAAVRCVAIHAPPPPHHAMRPTTWRPFEAQSSGSTRGQRCSPPFFFLLSVSVFGRRPRAACARLSARTQTNARLIESTFALVRSASTFIATFARLLRVGRCCLHTAIGCTATHLCTSNRRPANSSQLSQLSQLQSVAARRLPLIQFCLRAQMPPIF